MQYGMIRKCRTWLVWARKVVLTQGCRNIYCEISGVICQKSLHPAFFIYLATPRPSSTAWRAGPLCFDVVERLESPCFEEQELSYYEIRENISCPYYCPVTSTSARSDLRWFPTGRGVHGCRGLVEPSLPLVVKCQPFLSPCS